MRSRRWASRTRAEVAVIAPTITEAELRELDRVGVRGVRFTQHDPATAVTTPEMIEPIATRIAELGWHAQIHMRGEQLVAIAEMVARLPCTIVIDHMGRLPQPEASTIPRSTS
jgi:predicted TIM-barrel fold metal-dependent hydrolase